MKTKTFKWCYNENVTVKGREDGTLTILALDPGCVIDSANLITSRTHTIREWRKICAKPYNQLLDEEEYLDDKQALHLVKRINRFLPDILGPALSTLSRPEGCVKVYDGDSLCIYVLASMIRNGSACDLTRIDVSEVREMWGLFENSDFNGNVSGWDVGKLIAAERMFCGATKFNGDLSRWRPRSLEIASHMFEDCPFNSSVSEWGVGKLRIADYMFSQSKFNQDISAWDVRHLVSAEGFCMLGDFKQDISRWYMPLMTDAALLCMFDEDEQEDAEEPFPQEYKPRKLQELEKQDNE